MCVHVALLLSQNPLYHSFDVFQLFLFLESFFVILTHIGHGHADRGGRHVRAARQSNDSRSSGLLHQERKRLSHYGTEVCHFQAC